MRRKGESMSDAEASEVSSGLSKEFLCKSCHFCGPGSNSEVVYCLTTGCKVEPVLRKEIKKYEDCPHRSVPNLNEKQLMKLAAYARAIKTSSGAELQFFEDSLRKSWNIQKIKPKGRFRAAFVLAIAFLFEQTSVATIAKIYRRLASFSSSFPEEKTSCSEL